MNSPVPPSAPKKGLSGLAIAGIGCGTLALIAFLGGGLLVAKGCSKVKEFANDPAKAGVWALEMHPDIEVLNKDDIKREITFKTKSTGETTTISYEDIAQGKLTLKNGDGKEYGFDASKAETEGVVIKGPDGQVINAGKAGTSTPPAEVPQMPGLQWQNGGFRMEQADAITGLAVGTMVGEVSAAQDYYENALKAAGYELTTTSGNGSVSLAGNKGDGASSIGVVISPQEDKPGHLQITTQYRLAKP